VSTDLVYLARRLLGLAPVPASFRTLDPSLPSDAAIAANVDADLAWFDVDASSRADAASDVVYITRRLLGLTAVPATFRNLDPTIPLDTEIAARIDLLCPASP
jgi:hypothetical protein